jgi:oxepin-CoA hydrolase/3-oxo-5,6-dehydrosuberyl-CoA semialdehyde dehydrogenase
MATRRRATPDCGSHQRRKGGRRVAETRVVASYVTGDWYAPADAAEVLRSPVDGRELVGVSSKGIDFATVLDHARSVGRPSLQKHTFHERAAMLKGLVSVLVEHKDELYDLSADTGATRFDAWLDIDGGIGVLASYASRALRELPNGRFLVDGGPEPLSRDGSFIGRHIRTPLQGVAVHINAFNFPCWGELEKFAPAFLAGVPVVAKPASPTAYVAERVIRLMIESGVLPPGSLQMIAGSTGDMLDLLTGQDYVGFTGSAQTATMLRGLESIRSRSVRFMAETDSLNSAILTLSNGSDSPEIDLFIDEIVKEIKAKSGQRCTSIRRALVPEAAMEMVLERLEGRIGDLKVGDPRDPATDLGPLVSARQVGEVDAAVATLRAGCEVVNDPARFGLDQLHPDGAYYAPTILLAADVDFAPIHNVEPFGPVTTLVPYADPAEAIEIAALGGGSLVASVYSENPELARELVLGLAPYHGRVLVVDTECAASSTGHGSALPHLVHGGPGRAGGGEELGGLRGIYHYMQTTGIQGSPGTVTLVEDGAEQAGGAM